MAPSAIPLWGPVRWGLSIPEPPNVRSRVLFRSDRGHYRRREAPDPQRLQRGRGFVHVKARQAFPEIGRQVRRREQTAVRASRWRRRSCRALPDAPAPPKLRDRVSGWDLEFESGLLQQTVRVSPRLGRYRSKSPRFRAGVHWLRSAETRSTVESAQTGAVISVGRYSSTAVSLM
jgi:hypothetical protein